MTRTARILFSLLSALAVVVTANIAPQVLCLAPDGRIALETVLTGCRGTSEAFCMKQAVIADCRGAAGHDHSPSECGAVPDRCDDILVKNTADPPPTKDGSSPRPGYRGTGVPKAGVPSASRQSHFPGNPPPKRPPPLERNTALLI